MKRLIIITAICFSTIMTWGQNQTKEAEIGFEKTEYDLGDLTHGMSSEYKIPFENSGDKPLVLSKVKTSCGCTASEWPREPIMPGKSGFITVRYNTSKTGSFQKSLNVFSNAINSNVHLKIKGKVSKKIDNIASKGQKLEL